MTKKILTTTVGSFPKPDFVQIPDWFRLGTAAYDPKAYNTFLEQHGEEIHEQIRRGVEDILRFQESVGLDILTDGEIPRENYIHHHCRHLNGFDFDNLTRQSQRNGAYESDLPTIRGPLSLKEPYVAGEWKLAQDMTSRPVKMALPGPLTTQDTVANDYYTDDRSYFSALADIINAEFHNLVDAGCEWIQVDEPIFARKPQKAIDLGVEFIERCFNGIPSHVKKVMHMCCGYPDRLDSTDYPKADKEAYQTIMNALDDSCLDAISIEDAHRHNDLSLFEKFKKTTLILGVVQVASSTIETEEVIADRIREILTVVPPERLIVSSDCGVAMLPRELAQQKLTNMVNAVAKINQESLVTS